MAEQVLRVHLGLGSNLGDRWELLGRAVQRLLALDEECAVSPVYETAPVGGPPGQGPYLNCVVRLHAALAPAGLLALASALEREAGRRREVRFGPRTLDVDVLFLERVGPEGLVPLAVDTPELQVPHPRMAERAFVLAPLERLSPQLVLAGWRDRLGGAAAVAAAARPVGEIVLVPAP